MPAPADKTGAIPLTLNPSASEVQRDPRRTSSSDERREDPQAVLAPFPAERDQGGECESGRRQVNPAALEQPTRVPPHCRRVVLRRLVIRDQQQKQQGFAEREWAHLSGEARAIM